MNSLPQSPAPEPAAQRRRHGAPPVWAQRVLLVVDVAVSLWAGALVLLLPWTHLWSDNPLLASWPGLQSLLDFNFVRGMISGIGLLDIWIGVSDAVHYRDLR